jgi:hypothetical protein
MTNQEGGVGDRSPESMTPFEWEDGALSGEVAQAVLGMLIEFNEWVHRRKEQAIVSGETHLSWRSSVDFTVPRQADLQFRWMDENPVILVPIDVLAKAPLMAFDLRDEWNNPVPTLTRRQNSLIAYAGLKAWAEGLLLDAERAVSPGLNERLERVVDSAPQDALRLVAELQDSEDPDDQVIAADEAFLSVLQWLAGGFILIGVLCGGAGDRRILKYTYEQSLRSGSDLEQRTKWEVALERLGWSDTKVSLPVPMFRDCESFHFEAIPPDGTHFVDIALADLSRRLPGGQVDPNWTLGYQHLGTSTSHVAHLSVSRTSLRDDPADPDEFLDPAVVFSLRIDRTGWLRSALLASVFVAVFLIVTAIPIKAWDEPASSSTECTVRFSDEEAGSGEALVESVVRCIDEATPQPFDLDPAGIMIGLVGLVSLAVVRTGEHAFTARAVRWLRTVAVGSSALPIAAGWLIVFADPDSRLLDTGWNTLIGLSIAAACVLGWAYLRRSNPPAADEADAATDVAGDRGTAA